MFLYCLLDFFQNVSSLMSLCLSSYGLAYAVGHPWLWNNVLIVSCISTTIICSAIRQAIDKQFLEKYIKDKSTTSKPSMLEKYINNKCSPVSNTPTFIEP